MDIADISYQKPDISQVPIHRGYSNIGDICECHLYFDDITTILRLQKSVVRLRYRADEASQWSVAEFG